MRSGDSEPGIMFPRKAVQKLNPFLKDGAQDKERMDLFLTI